MSNLKTLTASALAIAAKVSSAVAHRRHGDDYEYSARVTSTSDLRVGAKYRVRFADEGITRLVKLHPKRS